MHTRTEEDTRAELIDPKLKQAGWGEVEDSRVLREFRFTDGKINTGGQRSKPEIADYILVYKNKKIAVVEAKKDSLHVGEGVAQAKIYAEKLKIDNTFSTNGKEIYHISMESGKEGLVGKFPTPEELWNRINSDYNQWHENFSQIPFESIGGAKSARYYQEIAVNNVLDAVANDKKRILLTLATGTGKTFISFQIAWKLFHSRWNLQKDGGRRPRILFLADRNILADQAFNSFSAFPEDALVRIDPKDIRKKGVVPTNGSIFFTIFQTFMSGPDNTPNYGEYDSDFFDFIIIDECHRGGANNESNWRGILDYFSPAVQLGLTATPKRKDNVDTYRYFGEPVYIYSLREGVNDGFLTPFKVKRVQTTLDEYRYVSDDDVVEGEIEEGKVYTEPDFNRTIEIQEREAKRVKIFLEEIDQDQKSIIFCANQGHALLVRDLINQFKDSSDPHYCERVTANDGARGEQYLREFQDNEKTIPTILTTSQKLSTGVDARNVRNIVLMRPINSMIEFKQIVGRGTRLFDGKEYFTIYDFVDACKHFEDPEWDGDPIDEVKETIGVDVKTPGESIVEEVEKSEESGEKFKRIKIKLRDGKEQEIQHMIATSFWSAEGKPISLEEFLQNLNEMLPEFFENEEELREIWSDVVSRKNFLENIFDSGFGKEELQSLQKMIEPDDNDLFDALLFYSFGTTPISRQDRVDKSLESIFEDLDEPQKDFINFVLEQYVAKGYEELDESNLPKLIDLKYSSVLDAENLLDGVEKIRSLFFEMQKKLYLV